MAELASKPGPESTTGVATLGTRSVLWSIAGLAMLVVIATASTFTLRQVNESDYWVDHTRQVITANQRLLSDVKDAESAERGYIITGDDNYLEPYRSAAQDIPRTESRLLELTTDNPTQQEGVKHLSTLIEQRMAVLATALQQRKAKGPEAAQRVVVEGRGLSVMQSIRAASSDIENEEQLLLQQRQLTRQTRVKTGFAMTLAAALLALVALMVAPFDVHRALRLRNLAQQEKEESQLTTQALFQSAAQAILIVDGGGRIVMTNPATEKLFGYSGEELIGQNVDRLVPQSLRSGHKHNRDQYFRSPQTRPMGLGMNLQARRKDGTELFVEISLSYVRTPKETLAVAFVSDISKRRADELAILQQREDLGSLTRRLMTAQDDERRRVARDLHDDLSQQLAFLAIDLGKLASRPGASDVAENIRSLQMRAAEAAETVRRISHQLHPSILDDIGLEAALEQYCEEFQRRTGIATSFTSNGVPEALSREIAGSLYHIGLECLRNVSKHANARAVSVALETVGGALRLTVKDTGVGLGVDQTRAGRGIGIVAMKERANLVNGNVSIQSNAGEGTEVRVDVPVTSAV